MSKPIRLALLSLVPFVVLTLIVILRVEPVFSILRPDDMSLLAQILFVFVGLFLPLVGAFVAIKPVFSPIVKGSKNTYFANCLVAILIAIVSLSATIALSAQSLR